MYVVYTFVVGCLTDFTVPKLAGSLEGKVWEKQSADVIYFSTHFNLGYLMRIILCIMLNNIYYINLYY